MHGPYAGILSGPVALPAFICCKASRVVITIMTYWSGNSSFSVNTKSWSSYCKRGKCSVTDRKKSLILLAKIQQSAIIE